MSKAYRRSRFARSCSPFRGSVNAHGRAGAQRGLQGCESAGAEAVKQLGFSAMPPYSCPHSSRQSRISAPTALALATTAAYNRSIHTDTQVLPAAARPRLMGAGDFRR